MRAEIEAIIREHSGKLSPEALKKAEIYVAPNIPPEYLQRAVSSFGAGVDDADVLVLVNTALIRKGASGLFLTDRAIYKSGDFTNSLGHEEFQKIFAVDFQVTFWTEFLKINDSVFFSELSKVPLKFLADLLTAIMRAVAGRLSASNIPDRLRELQALHAEGLITDEEYAKIRTKYVSQL